MTIKNIFNKIKNLFITSEDEICISNRGIGFLPQETCYVIQHIYFFKYEIKTKKFYTIEDWRNGIESKPKTERVVIQGFLKNKNDII